MCRAAVLDVAFVGGDEVGLAELRGVVNVGDWWGLQAEGAGRVWAEDVGAQEIRQAFAVYVLAWTANQESWKRTTRGVYSLKLTISWYRAQQCTTYLA